MNAIYYLRNATPDDREKILSIIRNAQLFLKSQGLPQWQDGYGPNQAHIEQDLSQQAGYVWMVNHRISGYAALCGGEDDHYTHITEGCWDTGYTCYLSIHRVAIDAAFRGRGLSVYFLRELIKTACALGYQDIRIDTHPLNHIMEKAIISAGFTYKGMICLPIPHGERRAYQLLSDTAHFFERKY